jgi:hypothetical protein
MIITPEMYKTVSPFSEFVDDEIADLGLPKEYNDIINELTANGDPNTLIPMFEFNLSKLIQINGAYTLGGYRIADPITRQYSQFANLSDAQARKAVNTAAFIAFEDQSFSVNAAVKNTDGSITWNPIDIKSLASLPDATYEVYDYVVNAYESYTTTADALAAVQAIETKLSAMVPGIQQQITSSDGLQTAWIKAE